jgi:hypothetical protein
LKTTYTGTITVDVDSLTNPTTITFLSASAVAANSGNWLPEVGGGSVGDPGVEGDANPGTAAPANYGFFLDYGPGLAVMYGASRDSIFSLDAPAQPVVAGQFDPAPLRVTIPQGEFDANISSNVFGDSAARQTTTDLTGMNCVVNADTNNNGCGGAMGSYSVAGNLATLTVPIDFRIGGGTPVVGFTGTFVATHQLGELGVPGDYNNNGTVDGADYVLWRKGGPLQNEVDTPGTVDAADYAAWRARFGNTSGSGAGASSAAVPEPMSALLFLIGITYLRFKRRRSA